MPSTSHETHWEVREASPVFCDALPKDESRDQSMDLKLEMDEFKPDGEIKMEPIDDYVEPKEEPLADVSFALLIETHH